VTGGTSFDGLIIAGGQVNLQSGGIITLKADYDKAADAMAAKDTLGYQAADYMINGSLYLKNGTVTTTGEDLVSYEDYVNFSNWKKE
jgi:hypothetical protein